MEVDPVHRGAQGDEPVEADDPIYFGKEFEKELMISLALKKLDSLSDEEIRNITKPSGAIRVYPVLQMKEVPNAAPHRLMAYLRFCPISQFYGSSQRTVIRCLPTKTQAIMAISNMYVEWQRLLNETKERVDEAPSEDEKSSQNSDRQD